MIFWYIHSSETLKVIKRSIAITTFSHSLNYQLFYSSPNFQDEVSGEMTKACHGAEGGFIRGTQAGRSDFGDQTTGGIVSIIWPLRSCWQKKMIDTSRFVLLYEHFRSNAWSEGRSFFAEKMLPRISSCITKLMIDHNEKHKNYVYWFLFNFMERSFTKYSYM